MGCSVRGGAGMGDGLCVRRKQREQPELHVGGRPDDERMVEFQFAIHGQWVGYVSHQGSEFVEGVVLPGQQPSGPTISVDPTTGDKVTNQPPVGVWVQRYYLDVVDFADAKNPTVRPAVNIPGQLNGVARQGALLYTIAPHWINWTTDWNEWLDVSAYDGVAAALVTSLALPKDWPHPSSVNESTVYLARPDTTANTSTLETWQLSDSGVFTRAASSAWLNRQCPGRFRQSPRTPTQFHGTPARRHQPRCSGHDRQRTASGLPRLRPKHRHRVAHERPLGAPGRHGVSRVVRITRKQQQARA